MTVHHQSSNVNNTEKNIEYGSGNSNGESGMVSFESLSEDPKKEEIRIEEWSEDAGSSSLKDLDSEDEDTEEIGHEIAASDDCAGSFGNIVVKNSKDVHFGNNTFYQGPVTIKQFVYKGADSDKLPLENGGTDNLGYQIQNVIPTTTNNAANFENLNQNIVTDNCEEKRPTKGVHWLNLIYKKRKLYSICAAGVLTILLIILIVLLANKYNYTPKSSGDYEESTEQENNVPIPPPSGESTLSGKLKIIPRIEWLAQPPEKPTDKLVLPVPYVIIAHTATENCSDQAKCTAIVRYIQTYHMESKGWLDIGYNFLVGGDGYVYEGRGWKNVGAHVYGWNTRSIGISFVGTFNNILPPNRQILACKQLIEKGVKDGYVANNYKLFAHRQLSSTQSPGEVLYENIKTWPHWAEKP